MPPKKRSRVASPQPPTSDSPPAKRQTRSRTAKAVDDDANAAEDAPAVTESKAKVTKPPAKKQTRAKKPKATDITDAEPAKDDDVVNDDQDTAVLEPPTKKQTRTKKTQKPVEVTDTEPADDEVKVTDAQPTASPEPPTRKASRSQEDKTVGIGGAEKFAEAVKVGEAQVATNKRLYIPVDEHCPLASHHVYIDSQDGIIYDASLNQTNASNNNNKFYRVQLLASSNGNYQTWTRWGRVGDRGQSKLLGYGDLGSAMAQFEAKFKDKSGLRWANRGENPVGGKYVFLERSYEPEDDQPQAKAGASRGRSKSPAKCTLDPSVQSLMELIFNEQYFSAVMENLNYDVEKLPLGRLGKATITRGFQALKELSVLLPDPASAAASAQATSAPAEVERLSNLYYSLIPHAFGRNRPPVIRSQQMIKQEVELLESLSDLKDADNILKAEDEGEEAIHPLDFRFSSLGMSEMTTLEKTGNEFKEISQYLLNTKGDLHHINYEVEDIFRIERQGENARFDQSPYANIGSDRKLLWHGSRTTNYGGILSQGLRIAPPEAPVSGYMFDKGIYLADMSSKSANYCYSMLSGGYGLLMLCEAELGNPMQVLQGADYDAAVKAKKQGMYSTWGQGTTGPKGWKDAECVHPSLAGVMMPDTSEIPGPTNVKNAYLAYNEYIAYDVAQVRLRYLLRVRM